MTDTLPIDGDMANALRGLKIDAIETTETKIEDGGTVHHIDAITLANGWHIVFESYAADHEDAIAAFVILPEPKHGAARRKETPR